ncbi:MAG TPA: CDP-alcohol phosphatidyltransferase family protein [Thiobacillaceae bacterium]|nr:CDP-alcohol phosphatidyltransferase family protein [Thiobacillaceae bacterium]
MKRKTVKPVLDRKFTLPNLLTSLRLLLAPIVLWRVLEGDMPGAFWVFVAAAVTDLLDGNIARLFNQRSVLGAWLDPIADKVMLLSTLVALVWVEVLPVWLLVVVGLRDAVVLLGAAAYRLLTGGLEVRPTLSGKVATFVEFTLVSLALAEEALRPGMDWILPWLAGLAAFTVILSGVRYVIIWTDKTRAFLAQQRDLD